MTEAVTKVLCLLLLFLPALVAFSLAVASADVTIVTTERSGPPGKLGKPSERTDYYKGTKARTDTKGADHYDIGDLQSGEIALVHPKRKQVQVWSREHVQLAMHARTEIFGGALDTLKNPSLNKTGNTKTIKGYLCHEYVLTGDGIQGVAWVTEEVDTKELEPFSWFASFSGIPISVSMTLTMAGRSVTTLVEVQRISREPIPDSLFAIPRDYTARGAFSRDPAEVEKERKEAGLIEKRRRQFERSVTLGATTYQLSCPTSHEQLASRHPTVYERITFVVPITVATPGKYFIRFAYTPELGEDPRALRMSKKGEWTKEETLELAAGKHQLRFVYSWGEMWGMFVPGPESMIELSVDKYTTEEQIFKGVGSGERSRDPHYWNVFTRKQRLPTVANLFTSSGPRSLVCP